MNAICLQRTFCRKYWPKTASSGCHCFWLRGAVAEAAGEQCRFDEPCRTERHCPDERERRPTGTVYGEKRGGASAQPGVDSQGVGVLGRA